MVPATLWTSLTFMVSLVTASPLNPDASALEKRDSSFLIGYRGVSAAEAQKYMKAGNFLTYDTSGGPTNRAVSTTQFNLLNKAWVPETADDGCTALWGNEFTSNRAAYLTSRGGSSFTTDNTLLFSLIKGVTDKSQLLIPAKLIQAGQVKFAVNCADITDTAAYGAIEALGAVDWYSWTNVKGDPQHVTT
ncbi:hypothetical protein E0Z10_g717 [Xylaria hypoxylon]|uniref:Uncharacterized protein n=1 Tax=Xylaria hypoxylon TaxID=37992 RepID=A0A4Z0Z6V8_9PEZI|nr:hypothetical protein E0Z10_g717 [Xylaria hypoxylon]